MFKFNIKLIYRLQEHEDVVRLYQTSRKCDPTEFYHAVSNLGCFQIDGKYSLDKGGCYLNKKEFIHPNTDEIIYYCHPIVKKSEDYQTKEKFVNNSYISYDEKNDEYELKDGWYDGSHRINFVLDQLFFDTKKQFMKKLNFFQRLNENSVEMKYSKYLLQLQTKKCKIDKVIDDAWDVYDKKRLENNEKLLKEFEDKHLELINDGWKEIKET